MKPIVFLLGYILGLSSLPLVLKFAVRLFLGALRVHIPTRKVFLKGSR